MVGAILLVYVVFSTLVHAFILDAFLGLATPAHASSMAA